MVKDPIRRNETAIGDAAVLARTGRARAEWFTLLDAAGAIAWDHATIAGWLLQEHAVDPWWAQSVTVGYEQARGLRVPGQRPGGTFEASAGKTLRAPVEEVLAWLAESRRRSRWLDVDPVVNGTPSARAVRWIWDDGTRVTIHLLAQPPDRTRICVQHKGLPDADALSPRRAYWAERLDALAAQLAP